MDADLKDPLAVHITRPRKYYQPSEEIYAGPQRRHRGCIH